ncbi:MAG: FtsW/RodA/SpoVE family cell cycle protein [Clostridiales bacterium]|nr:FtsW/RodA/SpoVE family cell cycle protein [Clostridiales bacterium]
MPKGKARYFYDYTLLFAVIFIFALGLIIIYSGSQYAAVLDNKSPEFYFRKQLRYGCFGLAGAVFLSILNYRWLVKIWNAFFSKAAYVLSVLLLAATELSGLASHGKTRWLSIGGRSFQTAELVKIGLIVFFAYYISKNMREDNQREIAGKVIVMAVIPVVMILTQNISSAFIVAMIVAVMIFVSVKNYKVFAALGAATVAGLVSAKPLVRLAIENNIISGRPSQYWMRRIVGWAAPEVFPDDAYQTVQSLYAIGSGGMTGHGLGESIQKFGKIPEVQNDMIFSIVCEEFGVIGAATLFLVFFYILYRIYEVARNAEDIHGTLLCTGVLAHLGIQIVLNIAVVTGVIPNTGVTLPFISYGGTALIVTMLEIGVVLSVAHKIKTGER